MLINTRKYFRLTTINIFLSLLFLLTIISGCEWILSPMVGELPFASFHVTVRKSDNNKIDFEIHSKHKFGYDARNLNGGFEVGSKKGIAWELNCINGRARKIEKITYGVNPAPDLFKEVTPSQPLENNVLYGVGWRGLFTYFKIVEDPKTKEGFIILQGDKPEDLKDLDH